MLLGGACSPPLVVGGIVGCNERAMGYGRRLARFPEAVALWLASLFAAPHITLLHARTASGVYQEMVVKAQAAIDSFKAGGVGTAEASGDGAGVAEAGRERNPGRMAPAQPARASSPSDEGRSVVRQIPPSEGMEPASDALTNGAVVKVDAGPGAGDAGDSEGSEQKTEGSAEGQPREIGDARKGAMVFLDDGVAKSRRKEEAIALSSHLQVIAMHLVRTASVVGFGGYRRR